MSKPMSKKPSYLLHRLARRLQQCLTITVASFALSNVVLPASAQSGEPTLTITTGKKDGTYYAFAEQIAQMLPRGMELNIAESDGSVHNLRRLLGYEGQNDGQYYQLAIVQADVLDQLRARAKGDRVLAGIVGRIRVVLPLYNEEIHVFARADLDVRGLDDIVERELTVNVGGKKSGTNLTARWLLELRDQTELTVEWSNVDFETGFPSVGKHYDVGFYVAGAPSPKAAAIDAETGVTLVPLDIPELYQMDDSPYSEVTIKREAYPWLKRDVKTVGVRSLLVAYDYDEKNPYCDLIATLTQSIMEKYPRMVADGRGHPKWKELDEVAARNRGDQYKCSARVLDARN